MGMSQRINDGALLRYSAVELIRFVTRTTLAEISTWSADELQRIGWTGNALVDILYSMTSAGVWIARTDANGEFTAQIKADTGYMKAFDWSQSCPTVSGNITAMLSTTGSLNYVRKIISVPCDVGAGGVDVTTLVPAKVGYYGVFKPVAFSHDDAAATEPCACFKDEDATSCTALGGSTLQVKSAADMDQHMLSFIEGGGECPAMFTGVANKAIEVQPGGLANNKIMTISGYYWYELAP